MYVEKDYILRLIHEMIRALAKLLLGKDIDKNEDMSLPFEVEEQYKQLIGMVDRGEINSAENILYDHLDLTNMQYLQMAVMFYKYLNEATDSYLTEHDFSRAEIMDGISRIAKCYGYGSIVEALIEEID